jgi:hypothetical protein
MAGFEGVAVFMGSEGIDIERRRFDETTGGREMARARANAGVADSARNEDGLSGWTRV